jgi:hypothetical protein
MRVTIRKALAKDAEAIVNTTNVAFMADAFFKKKEYHNRFTRDDVVAMMTAADSCFIVAECEDFDIDDEKSSGGGGGDDSNNVPVVVRDVLNAGPTKGSPTKAFTPVSLLCGSMYLHWTSEKTALVGKFSAVSVPAQFAKRGLGVALVAAAEEYLVRTLLPQQARHCSSARMEMGVINVRHDLFPWYEKQGYVRVGDMPHDDELQRILGDEHQQVCCVLMRKMLS